MSTGRFEEQPSFVWEIRDFCRLQALESPDFFAGNASYRMKVGYGCTPCDGKCLQIRLEKLSGESKKYYVCLDLSRENLKKGFKSFASFTRAFDKGVACVFLVPASEWAKPDDELAPHGSVKIICSFDGLEVGFQDPDRRKAWFGTSSSSAALCRHLRNLLVNGRHSDILVRCGRRTMHCHAPLLAARSRFLDNMVRSCEDGLLELDAAFEPVLAHLLSFVYCGTAGDVTQVRLPVLCAAAARYGLDELREQCFLAMRARLCRENVLEYLALWDALGNFEFKAAAVEFLVEAEDELLSGDAWRDFFQKNSRLGNEVLRAVLDMKSKRISFLRKISEIQRNK